MPLLFTIEPQTVFLVATLMILLNGGVLGLMHRTLAPDVQPSAFSWRVATLLQACGCILQAVQAQLPPGFVLPLANACILFGMTGRSVVTTVANGKVLMKDRRCTGFDEEEILAKVREGAVRLAKSING